MKNIKSITLLAFILLQTSIIYAQKKVLIIQDEKEQMEVLSDFLTQTDKNIQVEIVDQKHLPSNTSEYDAVILYIHRKLEEQTEVKVIDYTKNGGRFVCIHHSISSGKAKNKYFFPFLGIQLDGTEKSNDAEEIGAGYAWVEPVTLTIVNLNTQHYVCNHKINWKEKITYKSSDSPSVESEYPYMSFHESEVYLNHKFIDGREKTVLMGFKYFDKRNNLLFMQDRAAWYKKAGKGDIFYFMPGHSNLEFQNSNYAQMILNAINFEKK